MLYAISISIISIKVIRKQNPSRMKNQVRDVCSAASKRDRTPTSAWGGLIMNGWRVTESMSSSLLLQCGLSRNEGVGRNLQNLGGFLPCTRLSAGWEKKSNDAKNETLSPPKMWILQSYLLRGRTDGDFFLILSSAANLWRHRPGKICQCLIFADFSVFTLWRSELWLNLDLWMEPSF